MSGDKRPRPVIQVVRVTEAIAAPLAPFFREVWGDQRTPDQVRLGMRTSASTNPSVPGAEPPAVAYLRDGHVLGYLGTIPVDFWNGHSDSPGHWLKGFMVLEEHRNGPVGFAVLRELLKQVGVSGIMTVARPARRLFEAVGFTDCGTLPNYVLLIRPGRAAASLDIGALGLGLPAWLDHTARFAQRAGIARAAGAVAGIGFAGWRWLRGRSGALVVDIGGSLPSESELDDLWSRTRSTIAAAAVRNGRFLHWRYAPTPGGTYEAATVRDREVRHVVAVSVVRKPSNVPDPRLKGIRVATLSDLVFPADQPSAGLAALAGAERIARRLGADALLCTASHPAMDAVLTRRAFLRIPGNVHLMIRDPNGAAGLRTDSRLWWVTRGDANSDEVF